MSFDWRHTTVGTLLSSDGGELRTGPFGTSLKAEEYTDVGTPVIAVRDIGIGYITIDEKTPRIPPDVVKRLDVFKVIEGDILFGRKGAVERLALVTSKESGWLMGSDCIRLRLPNTVDPRFIAYAFQSPVHRTWMIQHATGSTMASLNQQIIELIPLNLPSLPEQRAIAHILGTLDDKIELNRQMNQTLEEMARALFQSWFVDFDPVHAKARGEQPAGLDPAIADLFPDRFVETEMGLVPEGWEITDLASLCTDIDYGFTASAQLAAIGPKFLRITDIVPEIIDWSTVPYCEISDDKIGKFLLKEGDIVVARTGATVGYAKRIGADHPQTVFASYLVRLRIQPEHSNLILGIAIESDRYKSYIQANRTGSAQPSANAKVITSYSLVIPTLQIQHQFDDLVMPFYSQREYLDQQSQILTELRDSLLLKLMSGELRVPEAAEMVEDIG